MTLRLTVLMNEIDDKKLNKKEKVHTDLLFEEYVNIFKI